MDGLVEAAPAPPGPQRSIRQNGVIPPERLARCHCVVVGVGAVGRQVALILAAAGVPRMILIDHDTVEEANLATQGYRPDQIGQHKARATETDCDNLNPMGGCVGYRERFNRQSTREYLGNRDEHDACVFLCVDSMGARKLVWESVRGKADFLVDGRMAAEVARVVCVAPPERHDGYEDTLFADDEAYAGSCTARSTGFCANVCAGLMVAQWARWLRGMAVTRDQTLNLLADELTVR